MPAGAGASSGGKKVGGRLLEQPARPVDRTHNKEHAAMSKTVARKQTAGNTGKRTITMRVTLTFPKGICRIARVFGRRKGMKAEAFLRAALRNYIASNRADYIGAV